MGSLDPATKGKKLDRPTTGQTGCMVSGLAACLQLGIAPSPPCQASSCGKAQALCDKKEHTSLLAEITEKSLIVMKGGLVAIRSRNLPPPTNSMRGRSDLVLF